MLCELVLEEHDNFFVECSHLFVGLVAIGCCRQVLNFETCSHGLEEFRDNLESGIGH